jgi:hypothetical protein
MEKKRRSTGRRKASGCKLNGIGESGMETAVPLRVIGRLALIVVFLLTAGCNQSVRYGVDAHLDTMERVFIEGVDLGAEAEHRAR